MRVPGFAQFGGKHGESAAIKNLLAFHGATNPFTGKPFSEALCFGIAGGIGEGYTFSPSNTRRRYGGVSILGRHKAYATDASWYRGAFDRLGVKTRMTETTNVDRAFRYLARELDAGRPTIVYCSRPLLPFIHDVSATCNMGMHSFVVYEIDEAAKTVRGSDTAPTRVSLSMGALAAARKGVCTHKNRTLTISPPDSFTKETVASAVLDGLRACSTELLEQSMTQSVIHGIGYLIVTIVNDSHETGWLKAIGRTWGYHALRDLYSAIETVGTGGGLYRVLFADFLEEAAEITGLSDLSALSKSYRALGAGWSAFAHKSFPSEEPFLETKLLMRAARLVNEAVGEVGEPLIGKYMTRLKQIEGEMKKEFPWDLPTLEEHLLELRSDLLDLDRRESLALKVLADIVAQ